MLTLSTDDPFSFELNKIFIIIHKSSERHARSNIKYLAVALLVPSLRCFYNAFSSLLNTITNLLLDKENQQKKTLRLKMNKLLMKIIRSQMIQNKNKEITSTKTHSATTTSTTTTTKSETAEQTSINLSNDNESIKKQEPKTQVNIVISYIEQDDEQGIAFEVMLTFNF